ncbi:beta-galactosidase [Niabella hirudinis]|uniref:beta-galactosidase n=1 Tax=Niabella hirudinis TaxID=1285929 RepID=UPI003EC01263
MPKFLMAVLGVVCAGAITQKAVAQEKIPILAWYSIPATDATLERYQELKEAGFNLTFSHTSNFEDAKKALDLSAAVGIKSIFTCEELHSAPEATVNKIKNHPGLAGYFLQDEPVCDGFPKLGKWAARIKKTDDKHYCYLNLLPGMVSKEALGDTYEGYVRRFIKEVNIQVLSFDFYPIVKDQVRQQWYENLEIISRESRRSGKPFWAFALATAHNDYPVPNAAQLRLQMYTNLAYGAQYLQYFTYWNPETTTWDFHEAPITLKKKRSPVYDCIREVNAELQKRAFVFMGARVLSVRHTGDSIPVGTQKLENLPAQVKLLDTKKGAAVVSLLEKAGNQYLVIVNRSFHDPLDLQIAFNGNVDLVRKDGSMVNANKYGPGFVVEPGDVQIFRWQH